MILKVTSWLVFLLVITNVYSEHYVDVKEIKVITNNDYPSFTSSSDKWIIGNKVLGQAVQVDCSFRFKGKKDCTTDYIRITDGTIADLICTNVTKYSLHSKLNSIAIELNLKNNAALIKCNTTAMPYGRPDKPDTKSDEKTSGPIKPLKKITEEIQLDKDTDFSEINGNLTSNMNYLYKLRSAKGKNVYIKCHINVRMAPELNTKDKRCSVFRFKIDDGKKSRWTCESSYLYSYISNKMDVTITSGSENLEGDIKCSVTTINEITHSNFKKIPKGDIDSSEWGARQVTGTKKTTCDCGWSNKQASRIIFGIDTAKYEFPWSVSLQYKSSNFHFCGGSIITPHHILTAAHCIGTKKPEVILVVMGSYNNTDTRLSSGVKSIHQHDYNTKTHINDIAILELEKKVEYTQFVGPVCLPTKDPQINHKIVTAMGWGRIAKNETRDRAIQKKTNLRVVDIESCTIDWNYHWEVDDQRVICTWSNDSDICIGDSGGPVTWHDPEINRFTLVGVPALCDSCVLSLPSAHTAIHYFYDWIQEIIAKTSNPDAKTCSKID